MSQVLPDTVLLDVTPDDIKGAVQGDPWSCAVARALLRQLSVNDVEVVGSQDIVVDAGDVDVKYTAGKVLDAYIEKFDKTGKAEPRRFRLRKVVA